MIYRDACDNNLPWDKELPQDLMNSWNKWQGKLPSKIEVPRSLVPHREPIQAIVLHAFGDSSGQGTCAAVYAVVEQYQGTAQGLVTSKARLAKKGLTIPRLELVSGLMATKLLDNVKAVLDGLPIRHCYSWLDSMVALYWISGLGSYKQFVTNRVGLIQEKSYIIWKHVGTKDNPADIGSRGCQADQLSTKLLEGPEWLSNPNDWPSEVIIEAAEETEAEAKRQGGEIFKAAASQMGGDEFDELLSKCSLWRTMRITAGVTRFLHNLKTKQERRKIHEIIKKAQRRLFFLSQLKKSNIGTTKLIQFYTVCIRPILEYASPVFHDSLTAYLSNDLEMIQKRALRIIFP